MSTKIYNGFLFKGNLTDAHYAFADLRTEFMKMAITDLKTTVANKITSVIDNNTFGIEEDNRNAKKIASDIWHDLNDNLDKSTLKNEFNFNFEVVMIPMSRRKLLGLYYTSKSKYENLFRHKNFFAEYHYQNSTDRPDHISSREWNQRKKDWNEALKSSPVMSGASFKIVQFDYIPIIRPAELIDLYPSTENRLHRIGIDLHWKNFIKGLSDEEYKNKSFKLFRQHAEFLKTDKGLKELEQYKVIAALKLKPIDEIIKG